MASRGIREIDVSVVITAHHEGNLLIPCINSVLLSITKLNSLNLFAEIVLVLDLADDQTLNVAQILVDKHRLTLLRTEYGNPGQARNYGARNSMGKFISVIDGDDLVSSNWLAEAYELASQTTSDVVIHPEYVYAFGDRPAIFQMHDSTSGKYSFLDLVENNLWASPSFFNMNILTKVPYKNLTAQQGFGPEDWFWNIETIAAGYHHLTAKGTIYFYRTSNNSGVNNTHVDSLLPEIPINQLIQNLPLSLEDQVIQENVAGRKEMFRTTLIWLYRIGKAPLRPFVNAFPRTSRSVYLFLRNNYARITNQSIEQLASYLSETSNPLSLETNEKLFDLNHQTTQLAWLDPQISTAIEARYHLPVWEPVGGVFGELLSELIQELSQPDLNIVFVPWIGLGGADLVAINYVRALNELLPEHRNILISTGDPNKTDRKFIPEDLNFLQFDERFSNLSRELQAKLLAQLLVCIKPEIIINVNSPSFYDALRKFSKQISLVSSVFTCVFCFDRTQTGLPVHTAFDGSREYLSRVSKILTDNTTTQNQLINIFGLSDEDIRVHRSPIAARSHSQILEMNTPPDQESCRETLKVLWAHRFDRQKRPDILLQIVEKCRNKNVDVEFHIYGANVMGNLEPAIKQLETTDVIFHGTFTGGLQSVIHEEYDAFLITSEWEGLPTIAIQAIEVGLPIISSNVGGMPDLIPDSSYGFLIENLENIEGYVDAIQVLQQDKQLRKEISNQAKKNLSANYRWEQFIESVSKDIIDFSKVS